ncbi:MAG: MBL fold metallo-hydrolase [Phycisphaerales bacterium]|nr:MBL fold metallo-hydrolase [Phycisphaerae bacterium]NNF42498.1 MBL fold metallo-hydrolase [Phycisphaerales bacterium]NNM25235.1 MBL fold metallo-hydrolase [Phycisphaerales bacterium]
MLLERFEVPGLAHYSYAVGCPGAGAIAIVDPERNIDRYLAFAQANHVRITHVLETHIHADYASGARDLATRAGATLALSAYDEGETYDVQYEHQPLRDGDALTLGRVRIVARHTPGHTPEHLAFLVYDEARTNETPIAMLSGDFLFVGSLGRPDLLGEDAKRALARRLFASVRATLSDLPDGIEIHPAHGAGSMCGAGMSGRPTSTLGYERFANPYLDPTLDEATFVERILGSVPPFPPYYRRMKTVNSVGPTPLADIPAHPALPATRFAELTDAGHVVIDLRSQVAFDGAHIPGSFGIGAGPNLPVWASWVVPYETPLLLVPGHPSEVEPSVAALRRIGLDDVVGFLEGGIEAWREAGGPMQQTALMQAPEVHERMTAGANLRLLDVRSDREWADGHAPGAMHITTGELAERLEEMPDHLGPIAVICGGGYRSVVAASVLQRAGYQNVIDVLGGMAAWRRAGLPVVTDQPVATPG